MEQHGILFIQMMINISGYDFPTNNASVAGMGSGRIPICISGRHRRPRAVETALLLVTRESVGVARDM